MYLLSLSCSPDPKLNAFIRCIICTIKMYLLSLSCSPDPKLNAFITCIICTIKIYLLSLSCSPDPKLNAFITCIICTIKMYILSLSCSPDPKLPSVKIMANDGRDQLWGKTKASFKYVYDYHLQDADWFMKADDDT